MGSEDSRCHWFYEIGETECAGCRDLALLKTVARAAEKLVGVGTLPASLDEHMAVVAALSAWKEQQR